MREESPQTSGKKLVEIGESIAKVHAKAASMRAIISKDAMFSQLSSVQSAAEAHAALLRRDLERRKANYASRELQYKQTIEDLEERVLKFRQKIAHSGETWECRMDFVYGLQREVMDNLRLFEDRSASIVNERERDLTRACRVRMADTTNELAELMQRKEAGMRAWKLRSDLLLKERQWASNLCAQLEKHNVELTQENAELVRRVTASENERKMLIKELAQFKKEIGRCHQVVKQLDLQIMAIRVPRDGNAQSDTPARSRDVLDSKSDGRLKCLDELKNLERLLEHQQKQLMATRTACVIDAEESVALQRLVRSRIIDISDSLKEQRTKLLSADQPKSDDDERNSADNDDDHRHSSKIAHLTWENRILTILYEKAFPPRGQGHMQQPEALRSRSLTMIRMATLPESVPPYQHEQHAKYNSRRKAKTISSTAVTPALASTMISTNPKPTAL